MIWTYATRYDLNDLAVEEMGEDGWELVSVVPCYHNGDHTYTVPHPGCVAHHKYWFKKERHK